MPFWELQKQLLVRVYFQQWSSQNKLILYFVTPLYLSQSSSAHIPEYTMVLMHCPSLLVLHDEGAVSIQAVTNGIDVIPFPIMFPLLSYTDYPPKPLLLCLVSSF